MWEQLTNPDIDSYDGEDKKSHSSFSGLLGHLLRLIRQLRVLESYLGTSLQKVTFRVASIQEKERAKKEGGMPDFNAQSSTSECKKVPLIKLRVCSYLKFSSGRLRDVEKFDPTRTTSKSKVRGYVQAQEALLGL